MQKRDVPFPYPLERNGVTNGDIPHLDHPVHGRGRPPSERTEQAILEATVELLAERGLAALTVEEVASRARVGKASVYRRWPSKGTLAFDAFVVEFLDRQPSPDTGSLRGDLLAALRAWVRTVKDPATGRTLRGLIAEVQRDAGLAEAWRERFVEPVRERHRLLVARAVERGELDGDVDADLLLDLVYGPAYHRLLQAHLPLDERFVEGVVAAVAAALDSGALERSGRRRSRRRAHDDPGTGEWP